MIIRHIIKAMVGSFLLLVALSSFGGTVTHTVRNDDTLWSVASKYGTTVEKIRKLNGLKGNSIAAGQKLIVTSSGSGAVANAVVDKPKSRTVIKESIRTASKTRKPVVESEKVVASGPLRLASNSAIVVDATTGQTLYSKNVDQTKPIASITKLMTAMVVLDANPSMQEIVTVTDDDVDYLKHTHSRLPVGTKLPRYDMLRLSLMSSENRAASSLSRHYPGGKAAFLKAMNNKATQLGMSHTRFYDATGLTPGNVSTAEDLVKMVRAASLYTLIHEFTTTPNREVAIRPNGVPLQYKNTNVLVRELADDWNISISKTGYTQEAGRCLVMMATVANRKAVMVMLDSEGKMSPVGDANRLKDWIESGHAPAQLAAR
ncbi:MAG TPA: D-alanyl-D-alanine endopeptidase [Pseudomonadales bacterium]|nr:D-alanyl-D-alanine endopeptidase [Pseudomonadales bacterium]